MDHRSIFFKIQVFDRIIEAVWDSGASVSCLSSAIFDSLQSKTPLKLSPSTTHLKAANQLPIETRGTVNLPVRIAEKVFDHTFHVLVKSDSDCLKGLDFLEDHKCDPMFSKKKLLICDTASVPLYHKNFEIPYNKVFPLSVSGYYFNPFRPHSSGAGVHPRLETTSNSIGGIVRTEWTVQWRQSLDGPRYVVQLQRGCNPGSCGKFR